MEQKLDVNSVVGNMVMFTPGPTSIFVGRASGAQAFEPHTFPLVRQEEVSYKQVTAPVSFQPGTRKATVIILSHILGHRFHDIGRR